jgi:polyferredoxin
VYAGWLADRLQRPGQWARLRTRVWLVFSAVFFGQLTLGLLGVERCLMTGELHLPVPALVVGGPLYRGEGLFMPILLLSTLVLVGPAWCSWLCYIGAWDNVLARRARMGRPPSPRVREWTRFGLLVATVVLALGLRWSGLDTLVAVLVAATFGLAGVGVMAWVSRRRGWMAHCTAFCPLGWLVVRLGKLSPFRIGIRPSCVSCATCRPDCRFGALDREAWQRQRVHDSCTLCGDCLQTCGALELRYGPLGDLASRRLLSVMVAALHAVFLGVARI